MIVVAVVSATIGFLFGVVAMVVTRPVRQAPLDLDELGIGAPSRPDMRGGIRR